MTNEADVQLGGRLRGVEVLGAPGAAADAGQADALAERLAEAERQFAQQLQAERDRVGQACKALADAADQVRKLQAELLAEAEQQLPLLAVEIARKVLQQEIQAGRHEIDPIVAEALRRVPVRQDVVVHLSPGDHARCAAAGEPPDGAAGVRFVADTSIRPAECLIETPEGIVESAVDSHLERISEELTGPE